MNLLLNLFGALLFCLSVTAQQTTPAPSIPSTGFAGLDPGNVAADQRGVVAISAGINESRPAVALITGPMRAALVQRIGGGLGGARRCAAGVFMKDKKGGSRAGNQ